MSVKAVIMAGGEGSRLRPLTCDRPKPLVPVCNRPVMAYTLDLLADHGLREVFVTLGYMPDSVSDWFGDCYRGMRLHYVTEPDPLGTAGSVAALRSSLDETFLVLSGDALTDIDLGRLIHSHRESGAMATLAMTRVENPLEYGVIMTDRRGRVRRFLEKPGWGEVFSDTVNIGIYVLEPSVLEGVPAGRMYDFSRHLFPALLQIDAPLYGTEPGGYWCDIGDPAAYLQANLDLLQRRLRFVPQGIEVAPGVWAAEGNPRGVLVQGPAMIAGGCRLQPGTRLEGGVVLGPDTVIGEGAVLRQTVTWSGVKIGGGATMVGAVLCDGVSVSNRAGVFSGAVVGSGCRIGEKATLAPGVRLWPQTEVSDGAGVGQTLVRSPVWSGRLLRKGAMVGRLGEDLFPENAVQVGTAYASVLSVRGPLVVGSDPGNAASLLRQALLCGAMAAGRDVIDVGTTASPVTQYAVIRREAAGGIHVGAGQGQSRTVFFDGGGRPVARELQRKLEQACSCQDFPRAYPEAAGVAEPFLEAELLYLEQLSERVDQTKIQEAGLRVAVLEYPRGAGINHGSVPWPVLGRWLERLGCRLWAEEDAHLRIQFDSLEGRWYLPGFTPEAMLALEFQLGLWAGDLPEGAVSVPVTATRAVEAIVRRAGRDPIRVRHADWLPADPLLTLGRLLEWVASEGLTEQDLRALLPRISTAARTVACPWAAKGRVMRCLLEEHAGGPIDLVDGIRIDGPDGWALLLPDPDEPVYQVFAEADDSAGAESLADHYSRRVRELLVP